MGLCPYYIISYNKQGSFQMIIKITTMDQGLSENFMYYGKSKICKKVHLCLHLAASCQSVTRCPPERSEGVGTCNQPWSSPSPHLQNEQSAVLQWPVTSTAIGARQGHPLQTRQCVAMVALSSAVVLPLQCHYLLVNALQWLP